MRVTKSTKRTSVIIMRSNFKEGRTEVHQEIKYADVGGAKTAWNLALHACKILSNDNERYWIRYK